MIPVNRFTNNHFNHVSVYINDNVKGIPLIYEDVDNRFEKDDDAHYKEITEEVERELNDKC